MTASYGCKKGDKNPDESNEAPQQPGQVESSSGASVEAQFEAQPTGFRVSLKNVPPDATSVRCKINDSPEVDCVSGLVLPALKDGLYLLTMTISTPKEGLVRSHQFSIIDGQYYHGVVTKNPPKNPGQPADPNGAQDIRFVLKPGPITEKFTNHNAVPRNKPLTFDFTLDNNQNCVPQYWCSYGQDIWWLCNSDSKASVTLEERELAQGFQKLLVKANCSANNFDSNIVELFWFGVSDKYQPRGIVKREVQGFTHYQMEKATDCLDEVSFECDEGNGSFRACSNVRINPAKGFQIRALCKKGDKIERGPIFSES